MSLLTILHEPDERLRRLAETVDPVDESIQKLSQDMVETMVEAAGCGLAAPQVGVLKTLFVINESFCRNPEKEGFSPLTLINPEIIWKSAETRVFDEGCLSLPGFSIPVERPAHIHMKYLTLEAEEAVIEADGLLAVCLQHEHDHLMGKLTIDYLPPKERSRAIQQLEAHKLKTKTYAT